MTTDELRRLLAEATPPPWTQGRGEEFAHWIDAANLVIVTTQEDRDAALIVAAVNALSWLLDVVEHATTVMRLLGERGPSIVPHLIDTDDNPGEYLRAALTRLDGAS